MNAQLVLEVETIFEPKSINYFIIVNQGYN